LNYSLETSAIEMKKGGKIIWITMGLLFLTSSCNDKESIVDTNTNSLVDITSKHQFDTDIETGVSTVFYHTFWCTRCKAQRPAVETIAEETAFGEVFFAEVEYESFTSIVEERGVKGFPTIVIYKNDKEEKRFTGQGHSADEIRKARHTVVE
jgi:thiol-disulfide isomerase/thioredoxin